MKNKHPIPPKAATRLLTWLLRSDMTEEVLGDLEEKFYSVAEHKSFLRAKLNYWYQVLNYLRPFAIKKSKSTSIQSTMVRHNLTLTFRNYRKYKTQFLINLTGLSTGLACVLFISLWVADEQSVDQFHEHRDQLYQVMSNHSDASGIHTLRGVPGMLLEEIQAKVPEVRYATASTDTHEFTLSSEESYFKADGKFASEDFLQVFSYPLVEGAGISDKSGILISESLAMRIFKSTHVTGKSLVWHFFNKKKAVVVAGVFQSIPHNSSDNFDFVMSWDFFHDDLITYKNWFNYYGRIAVVLNPSADPKMATDKIDALLKEHQQDGKVDLFLTRYSDLYLHGKYENGEQAGGRVENVGLFRIIALFILFIASINFINLSTAKATHRIKEIGVKKSLGASRGSLMGQYFTESLMLSLLSVVVAFLLVWLLLPQFNFLAQKQLTLNLTWPVIQTAGLLIIVVGVVAGSYPALYLSGLKAIEVLKGKLSRKTGEVWGRKSLVVIQFSLSIILIVSVLVVYQQMEFVKKKNLGYDRENLVYFEREGRLMDHSDAFVAELKNISGVTHAALSGFNVGGGNSTGGISWPGKTPEDQIQFWEINSGNGLVEMLGLELVTGRAFSAEFGADSSSVIFNETAIAAMGMADPLGKIISHYTGDKKIVGVVKDFNLVSLHTRVEPMVFLYKPADTHWVMARLKPGNEVATIQEMGSLYESFNPGYVFKPQFVDQDYQAQYAAEERVGVLSRYFAGFAVLISCLGLFGLAAFTAERRTKEIGIRKVMGSSVLGIVYLLSLDFTKMVLVAAMIAMPISYFIAADWLEDFAFRIGLEWWFFALAGLSALLVAWLTVALQTIRTARINPVECLRNE
ncbi:MAG: ABC transporter permease [Marinoscillum sp.]|uniref:ABC transporter permease n=1 Tax=Marinoscillum sp. TaxID=2024838 RepID=UPI003301AE14